MITTRISSAAACALGIALLVSNVGASPLANVLSKSGLLYLPHLSLSIDKWEKRASSHAHTPLERVIRAEEPELTTELLLRAMGLHMPGHARQSHPLTRQSRSGSDDITARVEGKKSAMVVTYRSSVPSEARAAFEVGLLAWADVFPSTINVRIYCGWEPLEGSTLAAATTPLFVPGSIPGADKLDDGTLYGATMAMSIQGADYVDPSEYHVHLVFNSLVSWHFGSEDTPFDRWDLTTTAMHEQGHGMIFSGLVDVQGSQANFVGGPSKPARFDQFLMAPSGAGLASACNNQPNELYSSVTNGALSFDDPAEPGTLFPLYSPSVYEPGSSTYHLDSDRLLSYCTAANISKAECSDLMTPSLPNGYTQRSIGTPTHRILESLRGSSPGISQSGSCTD